MFHLYVFDSCISLGSYVRRQGWAGERIFYSPLGIGRGRSIFRVWQILQLYRC